MISPSDGRPARAPRPEDRSHFGVRFATLSPTGGFLLGLGVLVPLVIASLGAMALIGSLHGASSADSYQSAAPCAASATPSSNCFVVVAAPITDVRVVQGSSGDTTFFTVGLPTGPVSTWALTSANEEDAIRTTTAGRVQLYQGKVTAVYVDGFTLITRDTPTRGLNDARLPAAVLLGGLALIVVVLVIYRRNPRMFGTDSDQADNQVEDDLHREFLGSYPAPAIPPSDYVQLPKLFTGHQASDPGWWWFRPLAVALIFPLMALRVGAAQSMLVVVVTGSAIVAVALVGVRWLRTRQRLIVDDLNVTLSDWWGRRQSVARSEIAGVALRTLSSFGGTVRDEPRLMLLARSGRCLLRVAGFNLPYAEASELAAILRVPIDPSWDRFTTPSDLGREIPDALSWLDAHPVLARAIRGGVLLVIVLGYVWAIYAFRRA